jgi:hypothetical protein
LVASFSIRTGVWVLVVSLLFWYSGSSFVNFPLVDLIWNVRITI